jgi:Uncharacterised protein family (UPF0175)
MGEHPGLTEAQRRGMVGSGEPTYKDTMMQVTIEVPDDIAEQMRQANSQDVARHILEAYALWAYQTGAIGGGQLRRLLGFATRDEVDQFLADHNATHSYTLAD